MRNTSPILRAAKCTMSNVCAIGCSSSMILYPDNNLDKVSGLENFIIIFRRIGLRNRYAVVVQVLLRELLDVVWVDLKLRDKGLIRVTDALDLLLLDAQHVGDNRVGAFIRQ